MDVQDTVCECATTANREQVALQASTCADEGHCQFMEDRKRATRGRRTITVNVEQLRALCEAVTHAEKPDQLTVQRPERRRSGSLHFSPSCPNRKSWFPSRGPCPCTSRRGSRGTCSPPRPRSVRGSATRAAGTGCRGRFPSTGSRLRAGISIVVRWVFGRLRRKRRKEREGVPAPPAMVPSRYGLISITFLTVPEAVHSHLRQRSAGIAYHAEHPAA